MTKLDWAKDLRRHLPRESRTDGWDRFKPYFDTSSQGCGTSCSLPGSAIADAVTALVLKLEEIATAAEFSASPVLYQIATLDLLDKARSSLEPLLTRTEDAMPRRENVRLVGFVPDIWKCARDARNGNYRTIATSLSVISGRLISINSRAQFDSINEQLREMRGTSDSRLENSERWTFAFEVARLTQNLATYVESPTSRPTSKD